MYIDLDDLELAKPYEDARYLISLFEKMRSRTGTIQSASRERRVSPATFRRSLFRSPPAPICRGSSARSGRKSASSSEPHPGLESVRAPKAVAHPQLPARGQRTVQGPASAALAEPGSDPRAGERAAAALRFTEERTCWRSSGSSVSGRRWPTPRLFARPPTPTGASDPRFGASSRVESPKATATKRRSTWPAI